MKRIASVSLSLILLSTVIAFTGVAQNDDRAALDDYLAGLRDGERDGRAGTSYLNILWGAIFGPFGAIYVYLSDVEVPAERLLAIQDKSKEYQEGYIEGFKKGAKDQRIKYHLIGWGISIVILIL
jgi:hypothetical protein